QDLLERAAELFPAPERSFERLVRRRDRKRRRQRVVVAVVALAIAAAAIGNVLVTFRGVVGPRPADRGIDSSNVGRLTLQWQARAPHIGVGFVGGVSAGEGVLLVASNDRLSAYDASCATDGDRCSAMWTAPGSFGPLSSEGDPWGSALIADGVAYAPSREGLVAFPLRCRTDGGECQPLWVSTTEGDFTSSQMDLVDGELYGSFYDPTTGTGEVYAMRASCDSSACPPDWVAHAPSRGWWFTAVSGERVIADTDRTLAAFPTDCRSDGGECAPTWTAPLPPKGSVVGIDDQNAYVRQPRGTFAYPISCEDHTCTPRWFAPGATTFESAQVGGGMVFASSEVDGGRLLAYAPDCGTGGEACKPSWMAPSWMARSRGGVSVLVAGGTVVAETRPGVAAFPVRCRDDGGVCPPRWVSEGPRPLALDAGTVRNGVLFAVTRSQVSGAGARDGVAAYPLHCAVGGGRCAPAWSWSVPPGKGWSALVVDEDHVYIVRTSLFTGAPTHIYAFGLPGGSPRATAAAAPFDISGRVRDVPGWVPFVVLLAVAVAVVALVIVRRRAGAPHALQSREG
ncbi:MAG: hypothetical protein ACXVWF_07080, partial [Actinomycetota bacterium]